MKDLTEQVINDLRKLESDRSDKEGCSNNRALWRKETWLLDAYHNALRTALALRKLLDEN